MNWLNHLSSLSNVFEKMSFYFNHALNENVALVTLFAVLMIALHGLYYAAIYNPLKWFINFSSSFKYDIFELIPIVVVILLVIFIHIVDIFVFSYIIDSMNVFDDSITAFYFVGEMYTTVGYGNYILEPQWKSLPLIIAFLGLFTFAISGSVLFTILAYIIDDRRKIKKHINL